MYKYLTAYKQNKLVRTQHDYVKEINFHIE